MDTPVQKNTTMLPKRYKSQAKRREDQSLDISPYSNSGGAYVLSPAQERSSKGD